MDRTALAVTAAAAILTEERRALLCQGRLSALVREPLRVVGRAQDMDGADHLRVIGAAEFRAFELVIAELGRLEPESFVRARHDVMLHAKSRDIEAVNHIFRAEHHAYGLAERQM